MQTDQEIRADLLSKIEKLSTENLRSLLEYAKGIYEYQKLTEKKDDLPEGK